MFFIIINSFLKIGTMFHLFIVLFGKSKLDSLEF